MSYIFLYCGGKPAESASLASSQRKKSTNFSPTPNPYTPTLAISLTLLSSPQCLGTEKDESQTRTDFARWGLLDACLYAAKKNRKFVFP